MEFFKNIYQGYLDTPYEKRTTEWWPVKHEWSIYAMFAGYLYVVLYWGPRYMEKRPAYNLKTFIKYYNIMQIIYNLSVIYGSISNGLFTDIGLGCVLVDPSPTGAPMNLVHVIYWAFFLRIIDFTETVVFVLRKKQRQVSFLHVYHHISTVLISQLSLKYFPGGMVVFPMLVNSTVHVVMYSYYYLSSLGPKVQRFINPFKPYITIMQMVQFIILLTHTTQTFFPHCVVPKWGAMVMFGNLLVNFVLFYNFYRKNYKNIEKSKKK